MEAVGSRGLISATTQHLAQHTARQTRLKRTWADRVAPVAWMPGEFPRDQGQQQRASWGTGLSHPCGHWALGQVPWLSRAPPRILPVGNKKPRAPGCTAVGAALGVQGSCLTQDRAEPSQDWRSRGPEEGAAGTASRGSPSLPMGMFVSLGRAITQGAEPPPKHMGCLPGYGLAALAS